MSASKKQRDLAEIIRELKTNPKTSYTKKDIEKAIVRIKLICDRRSIDNWFNLLFRLNYIQQPQPQQYILTDSIEVKGI